MKRTLVTLALVAALAGCSSASSTPKSPPTTHSASADASTTAAPRSLHDSCPLIEAAIPSNPIAPERHWATAVNRLQAISAAGDTETRNALRQLHGAVELMASDPAHGTPYLNAQEKLLAALSDVRARCRDVGSSAFQ